MTFSRNTLLAATLTFSTSVASFTEVEACGGRRSSGYSRSYSSYSSSSYHRPSYNYNYHSSYSRPVQVVQPVQPVQPVQQLQPVAPVQQQAAPVQQVGLQQVGPAQAPQTQPVPQQQLTPVQPQTPTQTAAPTQGPASAQLSALQALQGFAPPAASSTQPEVQTPAHVGTWSASLGNGSNVELVLNTDSSFTWSATNKDGAVSSFSGSYNVANGALTLTRSNDSQQLAGSMNLNGNNAFSFKVAGNNAAGIYFTRS